MNFAAERVGRHESRTIFKCLGEREPSKQWYIWASENRARAKMPLAVDSMHRTRYFATYQTSGDSNDSTAPQMYVRCLFPVTVPCLTNRTGRRAYHCCRTVPPHAVPRSEQGDAAGMKTRCRGLHASAGCVGSALVLWYPAPRNSTRRTSFQTTCQRWGSRRAWNSESSTKIWSSPWFAEGTDAPLTR